LNRTDDFHVPVPSGWQCFSEPQHLVTEYSYDSQGRLTESLGAAVRSVSENNSFVRIRRASWTVYDDVNRTVSHADGSVTLDETDNIVAKTIANPVSITVRDLAGYVIETITAFRDSCNGQLTASDVFPRVNWLTWETHRFSFGKMIAQRQYHEIPESGEGTSDEHYSETQFGYDIRGRRNRVINPNGMISRTVIDWRGNPVQTWLGTNDSGATDSSPKTSQNGNDMILVTESEFGGTSSCVSCSGTKDKLRVSIQHVDEDTVRVTEIGYDWRGRRTHVFHDNDASGNLIYDVHSYDNLNRAVKQETFLLVPNHGQNSASNSGYYGNGYYSNSSQESRETILSTNLTGDDRLLARVEQDYDVRGQVWRTENSVVDPATGFVRGKLVTERWYDAKGHVVRLHENRQNYVTENTFDSLGRHLSSRIIGLDGVVLQQTETIFDTNGNTLFTAHAERTVDAVGTGNLSLTSDPKGEFRYTGYWYDHAGRQIASADYGISRNSSELPACIFARNLSARLEKVIVRLQAGIKIAKQEFQAIADALSLLCELSSSDYATQILQESATVLQETELSDPQTVVIQLRNLLDSLYEELAVPESSETILVIRTNYDNKTGQAIATIDPAGRETRIEYDNLGRTIRTIANYQPDEFGADKNVTVEYSYSKTGKILTLTAINSSTGNQVTQYVYDKFDRVIKEIYPDSENALDDCVTFGYNSSNELVLKQDQNGSVHEYRYDNFGRLLTDTVTVLGTGVDDTVRKISTEYTVAGQIRTITSLDGEDNVVNQIMYQYDENGQLQREYTAHHGDVNIASTSFIGYEYDIAKTDNYFDNSLRLVSVTYPSGKTVSYEYDEYGRTAGINDGDNSLVEYKYQGVNSVLRTKYIEPNLTLDYTVSGALDRFGRITDHAWKNASGQNIVRIQHGYDQLGNRTYRNDKILPNMDELYSYDEINQIKFLNRGTLTTDNSTITNGNHAEAWNFDETGNWLQYNRNGSIENRIHNTANEILNTVTHDKNGNMTIMPSLQTHGSLLSATYDAWNRIVSVSNIADYRYDGRNHRISKVVDGIETISYFNQNWQELESVTGNQITSYIWGLRYIDDLVLRENGEERLYSLADPNWNVIAICNAVGNVVERYNYNAFGKRNVFDSGFTVKADSDFNWNRTFTGQVLDSETDLILYRNRFYSATLGRFVTRDPVAYSSEDMNIYRYTINNIMKYIDLYGLYCGAGIGCTGNADPIPIWQKNHPKTIPSLPPTPPSNPSFEQASGSPPVCITSAVNDPEWLYTITQDVAIPDIIAPSSPISLVLKLCSLVKNGNITIIKHTPDNLGPKQVGLPCECHYYVKQTCKKTCYKCNKKTETIFEGRGGGPTYQGKIVSEEWCNFDGSVGLTMYGCKCELIPPLPSPPNLCED
jgi:RHS repeat-associated protein